MDVLQYAIADKDGVGRLYITEASNTHSLIDSSGTAVSTIAVEIRKLDTLLKEIDFPRVDFIRMDIEGGEVGAVKGMGQTLKQYKPHLLIELHCDIVGIASIVNLLGSLKRFGYVPEYVVDRDKDLAWEKKRSITKVTSMENLVKLIRNYRVATVFLK